MVFDAYAIFIVKLNDVWSLSAICFTGKLNILCCEVVNPGPVIFGNILCWCLFLQIFIIIESECADIRYFVYKLEPMSK